MKHLLPFFIGLTLIASGGVLVAHAQGYTPLVSLPGATQEGVSTNMSAYLSGVIKLLIALGGAISILMAIIGGTQYVAAGIAPSAKEDAKNRITNAFIGLALILASYLILNSINPKLVQFGFMLPPVGTSPMATSTTPTSQPWPDDLVERAQLSSKNIMVTGTKTSTTCKTIGEQGCTSVSQLGAAAIGGLISLKESCISCAVVVTGGTEYWNHSQNTAHRPGNSVVDLSKNSFLDTKIQAGTSLGVQSTCSSLGPAYRLTGAGAGLYVNEGSHWHVCY